MPSGQTGKRVKAAPAAAFTLIELLAVMLIMTVILSISVPAFIGMGRGAELRGAVTAVRNTLVHSRQWAITHREAVTFCYTPSNYFVTNAAGLINATNALPVSVRFKEADEPSRVTFKPAGGLASGAANMVLTLDASNGTRTIRVNGLTGMISVDPS